jgi:glutamate dehydrogenase (NADP+)|tara:strand:+ start:280 stop:1623 length:1344 start_codon:yes stop_codon:yes gene_type:complete
MSKYVDDVIKKVGERNQSEPIFIQAVNEVYSSLHSVIDKHHAFKKANLLERLAEPEKQIIFSVPWIDDIGNVHVNRGYRVQFNSVLGPYKGGLRFHPSVNLGVMKFLGFEQTFKNSLTGLQIGGAKGGSDFDPNGKSDMEIMRFCQSFMLKLHDHLGHKTDVPAGDIGVGYKEIGYLFGQYKALHSKYESGLITGKAPAWGGIQGRKEATGYGTIYFAEEMLKNHHTDIKGKIITVSGFGQVSYGVVKKAVELGAKVVTISGPDGYIHMKDGIKKTMIPYMEVLRESNKDIVKPFAEKFGVDYIQGKKPWEVQCDIAIPSAIQNEINEKDAEMLIANGCKFIVEAANMPCTEEAIKLFNKNLVVVAPSKAVNAGGVAVSALEMRQNAGWDKWNFAEVDNKLRKIMKQIHTSCLRNARKYGTEGDYTLGANAGGFIRVANAALAHGII